MKLSDILEVTPALEQHGIDPFLNEDYDAITHREEYISKDSLFVEFKSQAADPVHRERITLTQKHHQKTRPEIIYQDLAKASQAIAIALYQKQIQSMRFLAVTGTNGKSTVVDFCRQLIHSLDPSMKAASLGTLGLTCANQHFATANTTPFPLDLYRHINDAYQMGSNILCLEASSHGLDQGRLIGLPFVASGFTNLSQDHLDYHNNFDEYLAAKKKLLLQTQQRFVVNLDCPRMSQVQADNMRRFSFSTTNPEANFYAKDLSFNELGCSGSLVEKGNGESPFQLASYGEHNVSNLLCAIAMLRELDYDFHDLVQNAQHCRAPKGRLDLVQRDGPGHIIIDYAHTPDALKRALKCLRRHAPQAKLKTLVGCGGNRDKGKRPLMANIAMQHSDECIFTSDNPRYEDPEHILDDMTQGLQANRSWTRVCDRIEAIEHAVKQLQEGEILLLAGKGHEQTQEINGETYPMDEESICRGVV